MARILDFPELEKAVRMAVRYLGQKRVIIRDWHIERTLVGGDTLRLVHSDGLIQEVVLIQDNVNRTAASIIEVARKAHH